MKRVVAIDPAAGFTTALRERAYVTPVEEVGLLAKAEPAGAIHWHTKFRFGN